MTPLRRRGPPRAAPAATVPQHQSPPQQRKPAIAGHGVIRRELLNADITAPLRTARKSVPFTQSRVA